MQIHYFGAARAAAGLSEERIDSVPATLGELLETLSTAHTGTTPAGTTLAQVFAQCSFLLDSKRTDSTDAPLAGVERVDVMPPFAGG